MISTMCGRDMLRIDCSEMKKVMEYEYHLGLREKTHTLVNIGIVFVEKTDNK